MNSRKTQYECLSMRQNDTQCTLESQSSGVRGFMVKTSTWGKRRRKSQINHRHNEFLQNMRPRQALSLCVSLATADAKNKRPSSFLKHLCGEQGETSHRSTTLPTKMPRVKESEASSEAKARTDLVRGIDPRYSSALRITSDQSLGKILSEA
jgi:hypothetical protein